MSAASMGDPLGSVRESYDRWASIYDHDANPLPALEQPFVEQAVGNVVLQVFFIRRGNQRLERSRRR